MSETQENTTPDAASTCTCGCSPEQKEATAAGRPGGCRCGDGAAADRPAQELPVAGSCGCGCG